MRSLYDAVAVKTSIIQQASSGSTPINGANSLDTLGFNTGVLRARGEASTGGASPFTIVVKLQESATGTGGWADALDNTGTVIGFTLTVTSVAAENLARIEGLGTNHKRFLRVVATPAPTGGAGPASIVMAEILLGRAFTNAVNTATSNT